MKIKKRIPYILASVCILLLVACAPAAEGGEVPVTGETAPAGTASVPSDLPPEAVLNAQRWLATQLSMAAEQVQIVEVEQAEWTDSCLGLGRLNESCLQAVTPGWRVVLEVNGQTYEVRTDETGSTVRVASPQGSLSEGFTLENTQWSLVSFGPQGSETPLVEDSTITLLLAEGQAGGEGGCNSYGGTYQVENGNISFNEITSTLKACADERVTEQEQRYFQALESAERYELDGNQLRITYDDGAGLLVFESSLTAGPGGPVPTVGTPGN